MAQHFPWLKPAQQRGLALWVYGTILPANKKGAWIPPLLQLLQSLAPVVAPGMGVLVLTDRGLWSPRLWQQIQSLGFHPLMRVKNHTSFQPLGGSRQAARQLLPGPAHAWVGQGKPFRRPTARRFGTLLAL